MILMAYTKELVSISNHLMMLNQMLCTFGIIYSVSNGYIAFIKYKNKQDIPTESGVNKK